MTVPLSLTGRYQLVILGTSGSTEAAKHASSMQAALGTALALLGVDAAKFLVQIIPGDLSSPLDRKMLSVGVYFGFSDPSKLTADESQLLDILLADGSLVIPVVEDLHSFVSSVPPQIAHLNGCAVGDCGKDFTRLATRVLEGFALLRERRRLFISYRRIEASSIAAQLYEALDAAGFDVFLDTHGVLRPGDVFQDVLWHRLADTDVAIVLDSPGFMASRWTEEEMARANQSNIQILQVLWPEQFEGAAAAFSTFDTLASHDFEGRDTVGTGARLRESSIASIVDKVEGLRARAVAARHSFLVREFLMEARSVGLKIRRTLDRNLVISTPHGDLMVRPAIGIPDSAGLEELEYLHVRDMEAGRKLIAPPVLLYDQKGIQSKWIDHLEWLNGNLSCARSLSLADAQTWLTSLKTSA